MTSLSPPRLPLPSAVRGFVAVLAAALVALALAGPAAATTPCGKRVLNDWWDNGRVDKLYPLHCYEEAIDAVPEDIRIYSDAEQILNRALQAAVRGKLDRGGPDPSSGSGNRVPPEPADAGTGGGVASGEVDSSSPSSVPIPLIILGGMSLALLAAGGLGYLSRRRREGDDGDSDDTGFAG